MVDTGEIGAGIWVLVCGCWVLDTGKLGLEHWELWTSRAGFWVLGAGCWELVWWVLESWCWVLRAGHWGAACWRWALAGLAVGKPWWCRGMFHIIFGLKREIERSKPHKVTAGLQAGLSGALGTAAGGREDTQGLLRAPNSSVLAVPRQGCVSRPPGEAGLGAGAGFGVARAICRPRSLALGCLHSTSAPAAKGFAQAQAGPNKQLPAPSSPAAALLHPEQHGPGATA